MGMQSEIKGQFTSATMLAAVNVALTAAGLTTISTTDGIKGNRELLWGSGAWPALAFDGPAWEQSGEVSGTERELHGEMTAYLLIASGDEPTLIGQAPDYGDALRAAVESTITSPIIRVECTSGNADGEPVAVEEPGVAARLIRQTYRVVARYNKATA